MHGEIYRRIFLFMAKDPAFLFYSQDFHTGTSTMPFEDRGKYITILCIMHQQGRMKEETIRFLVGYVSDMLRAKFKVDDQGFWFNERLEAEIQKRAEFTESRRNNGLKGGRPKASAKPSGLPSGKASANHKGNHMENENEDYIIIGGEKFSQDGTLNSLSLKEASLNGRCKEHGLPPWRTLVPIWFRNSAQLEFNDETHMFNAFSRFIIAKNYNLPEPEPKKYEEAAYNKTLWTLQAWEKAYDWQLKANNDFRKHFGYEELPSSKTVGINNNGRNGSSGASGSKT